MKIAVVGSGLGGLSAAWLLARGGHNVTIFEARDNLGMDAEGFNFQTDEGRSLRIDVPYRVIAVGHYTELYQLLELINVETELVNFSSSFALESDDQQHPIFEYRNIRIFNMFSIPLPTLRCLLQWRWWLILWNFIWLIFYSRLLTRSDVGEETFGEFVERRRFSPRFLEDFFFPVLSTALTCSVEQVRQYPADILLRFIRGAFFRGRGVRHARGGSKLICERLSAECTVRTGCRVKSVRGCSDASASQAVLVLEKSSRQYHFDHVIMATQPQHTRNIVASGLSPGFFQIPFAQSHVVVHTDESLYSRDRLSPIHYVVGDDSSPVTTLWLNQVIPELQSHSDLFQSWYSQGTPKRLLPDPATVLHESAFDRPVMTARSRHIIAQVQSRQGRGGIWYCGSYSLHETPFLENALKSGVRVAELIDPGLERPWDPSPPASSLAAFSRYSAMIIVAALLVYNFF